MLMVKSGGKTLNPGVCVTSRGDLLYSVGITHIF